MVSEGHRAVMFYLIQRGDCDFFSTAADIDPEYAGLLKKAVQAGVEILCYDCILTPNHIHLNRKIDVRL